MDGDGPVCADLAGCDVLVAVAEDVARDQVDPAHDENDDA